MYREAVIIVLIILLIIIGDILTHKFTTKTVAEISREIFLLTESVKNNKDDIQQKLNNIEKAWEKYSEKLAYYIEHNELEKVDTEIVKAKADIEVQNYAMAIENLERCTFILEHIKEKNSLKIVNVFYVVTLGTVQK